MVLVSMAQPLMDYLNLDFGLRTPSCPLSTLNLLLYSFSWLNRPLIFVEVHGKLEALLDLIRSFLDPLILAKERAEFRP